MKRRSNTSTKESQQGVGILELTVVIALVATLSTFAIMGIVKSRRAISVSNSTRELAGWFEKARVDSIRRHVDYTLITSPYSALPATMTASIPSCVQILGPTQYSVTMDFAGTGIPATRTFSVQNGVLITTKPEMIYWDWRGRTYWSGVITSVTVAMIHGSDAGISGAVDVSRSGDVTINSTVYEDSNVPTPTMNGTPPSGDGLASMLPTGTPSGSPSGSPSPSPSPSASPSPSPSASPTPSPTPTPSPSASPTPTPKASPTPSPTPTPTPTPAPTPVPCSVSVSPTSISIGKHGGSATITVTVNNASGSVGVSSSIPTNLTLLPPTQTLTGGGTLTGSFTITSNSNTRGNFNVSFSTQCGSASVTVTVTN